ncbi:MAG: amidohydrolase family protein [Rhodospirillaceae bacterium]|jgi:imidazolonepropionase-like amidohydrolase|nr:amidohydrolase family protein [Rhodospirillaceae bacterium]MBT5239354.1 amidohydrolase family protein [Rhodospirillaceae bacterium]MBT5566372.1 amidohydrolase family protein [Rhodospirillaceae bacterium]MBT6088465.1 amidohydrolase family protein [Rhodospirillaceae bacterium]MBT6962116.1 amidohydrolase family protein [Rhodospirillaceae bacterium]
MTTQITRHFLFVLTFSALFVAAPQIAAQSLLIQNVTLIDGTGAAPVEGVSVLVEEGRFVKISQDEMRTPSGVSVVDGTGKFLMPGIIDSHIHLPGGRAGPGNRQMVIDRSVGLKSLAAYLYSGVTAFYDSGNNAEYIYQMREDERAGRILSPRIYATVSLIAPPDGHGCCAGGTVVNDYEDGVKKLDALFKMKPDLLKFTRERRGMGPVGRNIPLLEQGLMNKLVAYAHANDIRTTVHVSEVALARESIEAGTDAFAHTVYLDDANKDFATLVADKGIILSTTMTRIEADTSFLDEPLYVATISEETRAAIRASERFNGSPYTGWLSSLRPAIMKNIKTLHEAGAILAMGTDRSLGPLPHQELKVIVESGITPVDAIRMGTLNAAAYIGVEDEIGSIEEGKLADMLLLNADPTVDINNTTEIHSVYKGGVWIDRAALDVPANQH